MRAAHLSNENAGRIDSDRTWDYDYLYEWSGRKRAPSQHHDRPKDREDATGEKGKGGKGTRGTRRKTGRAPPVLTTSRGRRRT
jgi:hypothetical protein